MNDRQIASEEEKNQKHGKPKKANCHKSIGIAELAELKKATRNTAI